MLFDRLQTLALLQLGDSAYPAGGFAFSWGLEGLAARIDWHGTQVRANVTAATVLVAASTWRLVLSITCLRIIGHDPDDNGRRKHYHTSRRTRVLPDGCRDMEMRTSRSGGNADTCRVGAGPAVLAMNVLMSRTFIPMHSERRHRYG